MAIDTEDPGDDIEFDEPGERQEDRAGWQTVDEIIRDHIENYKLPLEQWFIMWNGVIIKTYKGKFCWTSEASAKKAFLHHVRYSYLMWEIAELRNGNNHFTYQDVKDFYNQQINEDHVRFIKTNLWPTQ